MHSSSVVSFSSECLQYFGVELCPLQCIHNVYMQVVVERGEEREKEREREREREYSTEIDK